MAGEIDRATLLEQFVKGIDWMIGKSEAFNSPFGNQFRTYLFNARTTAETLKLDQEQAPSADDVEVGTPASGATPSQNFAGTGVEPVITAGAEPIAPVTSTTPGGPVAEIQRPDHVPANLWDILTPEQRIELIGEGHAAVSDEQVKEAAQDAPAGIPHPPADAVEDDPAATQQAPPWTDDAHGPTMTG